MHDRDYRTAIPAKQPQRRSRATDHSQFTPFERAVGNVLNSLKSGDVVTYGEVAIEAGYPKRARAVGAFLAEHGDDYPWWRVVTSNGRLVPGHEREHRRLLRREGIEVGDRVRPAARRR